MSGEAMGTTANGDPYQLERLKTSTFPKSYLEWLQENGDKYAKNFTTADSDNFPQLKVLDKYLRGTKGYIAGGCFKNLLKNEEPRDIDIYFRETSDFYDALNLYRSYVAKGQAQEVYQSKNTIAFTYAGKTVELIQSWFLKPTNLIMSFDFNLDKFAYSLEDLVFHKDFFMDLTLKRLTVSGKLVFPLATYNRLIKYAKYGYTPCYTTKFLIAHAIYELPADFDQSSVQEGFYEGFD